LRKAVKSRSKSHLEPDPVFTTAPPIASPLIGDVVTGSPSSNDGDPDIMPETEPSLFCLHFDMTGTTLGAADTSGAELGAPLPSALVIQQPFVYQNQKEK